MERKSIDEILAGEETLVPSSGFSASVMERVREEAAAPLPIPFPWKRAIPGMVIAASVLGGCAVEFARMAVPELAELRVAAPHVSAALVRPLEQAGWVALALGMALAAWMVSRRVAG
jgi:hypothetical protein